MYYGIGFTNLMRSCARTVPSSEALSTALPEARKATAVTGALCSVKVTKQKPLLEFHSFSLLSSPPVAITCRRVDTTPIRIIHLRYQPHHCSTGRRPREMVSICIGAVFLIVLSQVKTVKWAVPVRLARMRAR
jgi:hypothetical protein